MDRLLLLFNSACYCLWKETPFTAALQAAAHLYRWAQADADTKYCTAKSSVNSYKAFLAS